ncbi:3-hydroxyisobutyrate dehydrogenase [Rhizobium sp. YJ-22]|uniref:3-hydroxyisobutyrate dehydrogenase n=1 Tax=Rhizobium sp. YJ-22 TaxID=3037556 RepID=UPI0024122677|nr:3-hydroxyisobutyrate dehydrogenase [Rhizobium sp. YJ-22]MDG3577827.1 3-hydroxyisobutyrate dehydrogenase [Rhizobium sp. YJ-22]
MSIGFIGLGHMGGPMVANLAKAGHDVTGFDVVSVACDQARQSGLRVANTLEETVAGCDTVLTMLPAGRHVLNVWSQLVSLVPERTLLIDCSTIDIDSARQAHAMAAAHNCPSLDAPVSGGTAGAASGGLAFMVGGEQPVFAKAEPILQTMGKRIIHCGGASMGQAAKICNNMILGISMIAVGEAFVLAEKLGLAHQALFDVASVSSGQCWSLTTYCPVPGPVPTAPSNNGYRPGFAAALMLKDLDLSQAAAEVSGADTPLGRAALRLYRQFSESGGADRDFSAIIDMIRAQSVDRRG